jgi:hypothetical protein
MSEKGFQNTTALLIISSNYQPLKCLDLSMAPYRISYNLPDQHKYSYPQETRATHWTNSKIF